MVCGCLRRILLSLIMVHFPNILIHCPMSLELVSTLPRHVAPYISIYSANSCGDSQPIWDHAIGFSLIELPVVVLSRHLNVLFASHGKTNASEWLAKTKGRSGCQFSPTYGAMVHCPREVINRSGILHPTLIE